MIRGVFTFPWRKEILVFYGEKKIEMKLYYNLYSEQKLKLKKDLRKHGMIFSFVKGFKEQGFKNITMEEGQIGVEYIKGLNHFMEDG